MIITCGAHGGRGSRGHGRWEKWWTLSAAASALFMPCCNVHLCSAHFSYWMDVPSDKCRVCSCRSVKHVSSYRGHVVGMPCDCEAARHDPCLVIARVSRLSRPPPSCLPRLLDGGGWQQGAQQQQRHRSAACNRLACHVSCPSAGLRPSAAGLGRNGRRRCAWMVIASPRPLTPSLALS